MACSFLAVIEFEDLIMPLQVKFVAFWQKNSKLKIQSHFWILCIEFWISGLGDH
jgi:hypothetical protein